MPGITYREIIEAVHSTEGGSHPQKSDFLEKKVRQLEKLKFLERVESQPEQRKNPLNPTGPAPVAFAIETTKVITWPSTARLVLVVLNEDLISTLALFEKLASAQVVVHKTGNPFTQIDAENQLKFALERDYVRFVPEVPGYLKATDRTRRERPFLKKIADRSHLPLPSL